ncbi:unnamed protein product [Rotaria sp. Silwood2]|nr:unnamed protein product [Rotaria sp. Silwood2]
MERQVETINKLVSSYMQIVAKMTRDYIPKAIMYNIVQNVQKFVAKELLAHLYALPDPKSLLQESEEERQRRETKIAEYEAVKSALNIIENFHANARKVAGSVMSVSVLAAGVSSATVNTQMNNNFAPSPNFPSNTQQWRQPAPMYANPNAFGTRDPPMRPNLVPNPTGGNMTTLPAHMMSQPAMNQQGRASPQLGNLPAPLTPLTPIRSTPSVPPRPLERPPVPQRN